MSECAHGVWKLTPRSELRRQSFRSPSLGWVELFEIFRIFRPESSWCLGIVLSRPSRVIRVGGFYPADSEFVGTGGSRRSGAQRIAARTRRPQSRELIQELRVAGLGVQVLFGFLLALPFSVRFTKLDSSQRSLYVTALLLAAASTTLLCGPVAYHRLVFRLHQKDKLLKVANAMAIIGLVTVGLAISSAVILVVGFVDRGAPVVIIGVATVVSFATLWFAFPLVGRHRARERTPT